MIDEEDFQPRVRPPRMRNLDPLSLAELEAYIADLEAEIARVRDHIAAKHRIRSGAEGLFKKPE